MRKNEIDELEKIVEPLLGWYDAHARVLPWREEPTAYRVWVSEIMLQQTRVEAVKPYYERFLNALPDVEALADAEEEVLLKLWEGLGYYNRVRNLNKAARQIMEQYGGQIPDTYEELCKLAGIGSYTAGAIASIAFNRPVPAVDGNVLRVLSRVRMDGRDIMQQRVKTAVEQELLEIMPEGRAGAFNQALMELGAMVCIPNGEPKCGECPWHDFCKARLAGCMTEYPKKSKKKPRTIEYKTILVLQDANRTALQKRPSKGLLAGMYEFPWMEGNRSEEEVLAYIKELGLKAIRIRRLEDSKHIFTHKEWHMTGYAIRVDELESITGNGRLLFADKEETDTQYAIPSAYAAYLKAAHMDTLFRHIN